MKDFLSDQDNMKVNVLAMIIQRGEYVKLSEISERLSLSAKTVRSIILSLEENPYIEEQSIDINYNKVGKMKSVKIINGSLTDASFYYLEKSIPFLMIKELFLKGVLNKKKFCSDYFISPATFSRNRTKLKSTFLSFGLCLTKQNRLDGPELKIRNFYFLLFYNASSKWLFSREMKHFLNHSLLAHFPGLVKIDPGKKQMLRLAIYIIIIRNNQNCPSNKTLKLHLEGSLKELYVTIESYFSDSFPYFENKIAEAQYLFIFILKNQIKKIDEDELNIYEPLKEHNEVMSFFAKEIITHFFIEKKESEKKLIPNISLYFIYLESSFFDIARFQYININEFYFQRNQFETKLRQSTEKIAQKLYQNFPIFFEEIEHKNEKNRKAIVNSMVSFIYNLKIKYEPPLSQPVVSIYVQNSKEYAEEIIQHKIERVFSNRVEIRKHYHPDIDLYVTDKEYETPNSKAKRIYVPNYRDSFTMHKLFEVIEHLIEEKVSSEPLEYM
jgi:DNA-binding Lrp family transcriptional regulator